MSRAWSWNLCQVAADAKNKNPTLVNFAGALDWTVCQVWIYSCKDKLVFYNLIFVWGLKLKYVPISADTKRKDFTFENLSGASDSTVCQVQI